MQNGSEYVTELIEKAVASGESCAIVKGEWEIDTAIRIPSDFTLILDGCHLTMADGCYSNMFVNEHHDTREGRTISGADRNISIIGKNNPILDGGNYNGLSETTQNKDGLPPIWKNNLILFTNVDGFEISGISCRNQRWWATNFVYCRNGKLTNLDFEACDIGVDENGNQYHGLKHECYREVLVKNADGIDLRQGCHDIVIENITGFTEDDTVALTALNGNTERAFAVENLPKDICNVVIRNVSSSAYCSNVRLLNQDGMNLHDIYIDGVYDTSKDSPHLDRGISTVRIGDTYRYGKFSDEKGRIYNITVKNVKGRGAVAALQLACDVENLVTENIEGFDGTPTFKDDRNK